MKTCPICHVELIPTEKHTNSDGQTLAQDWICSADDHYYGHRIKTDSNKISILKIRFTELNKYLYCKLNFELEQSEIYCRLSGQEHNLQNRISVPHIIDINYNNINDLKQKIKTYLLFS